MGSYTVVKLLIAVVTAPEALEADAAASLALVVARAAFVFAVDALVLASLAFVFAVDADEADAEDNINASDLQEKSTEISTHRRTKAARSKIRYLGTSIRRIFVHHLQILSSIFSVIAWSPELPKWLVRSIEFVAHIFTVDLTQMFSSPECAAETTLREKWVIQLLVPVVLATVLLLWSGMVRCYLSQRRQALQEVIHTILHIAVRLLLLGLYSKAVTTSVQILSCEEDVNSGELVLTMDLNPCPLGPKGGNDRVLGVLGFVMI